MRGSSRLLAAGAILGGVAAAALPAAAQIDVATGQRLGAVAQDIVDRAVARAVRSVAILPFTLPDGGCTSLSSYLADEMMVQLFGLDTLPIEVVDRQNLGAIVTEAGLGDILDPVAGRELGRISGVDALVVGSLTLSADAIQVTVRLISIDAKVLGAAATTIPRTGTIEALLSQPVTGGPFCAGRAAAPAAGGTSTTGASAAAAEPGPQGAGGLTVALESIALAEGGAGATARLVLRNETAGPLSVMGVHPRLSLSDRLGNLIAFDVAVGLYNCDYSDVFESSTNGPDNCNARRGWSRATVLPAGAVHAVTLRGTRDEDYEGTLAGEAFDLSGTLMARGASDAFVLTVSFPGVVPE